MSLGTFRNALAWEEDGYVSIGGGEPTIHPLFWQMLGESIAATEHTWLATNGSITTVALALAKMAQKGVIGCALSIDSYHDPIDDVVVEAFRRGPRHHSGYDNRSTDCREVRDVDGKEINAGRCDFGTNGCVCPGLIVKPNGDVYACGCADAPCFGNINDGLELPEDWCPSECHKEQPDD